MKRVLVAAALVGALGSVPALAIELPAEIAKRGSLKVALVPNFRRWSSAIPPPTRCPVSTSISARRSAQLGVGSNGPRPALPSSCRRFRRAGWMPSCPASPTMRAGTTLLPSSIICAAVQNSSCSNPVRPSTRIWCAVRKGGRRQPPDHVSRPRSTSGARRMRQQSDPVRGYGRLGRCARGSGRVISTARCRATDAALCDRSGPASYAPVVIPSQRSSPASRCRSRKRRFSRRWLRRSTR